MPTDLNLHYYTAKLIKATSPTTRFISNASTDCSTNAFIEKVDQGYL